MGRVKEAVKKHIRNGATIACDVEADSAVIAGESGLAVLSQEQADLALAAATQLVSRTIKKF